MQKPIPAEVKGVPVDLYAVYPNGTTNYIGTATTDPLAGGVYAFPWTPPEEGTYTIIAVFKGDESYGSSSAGTVIHVTAAAPEAAAPAFTTDILIVAVSVVGAIAIADLIINIYTLRKQHK